MTQKISDEFYTEVMDTMYLPAAESYNGLRTIDVFNFIIHGWIFKLQLKLKLGKE
jgi:hypothetical protein